MRYLYVKVRKVVRSILKLELTRLILKFIVNNLNLPFWIRQYAVLAQSALSIQSSLSYLRNRCYFTGNSRWVINYFKLHRMQFKITASRARLTGIAKSSW